MTFSVTVVNDIDGVQDVIDIYPVICIQIPTLMYAVLVNVETKTTSVATVSFVPSVIGRGKEWHKTSPSVISCNRIILI